MILKALIVADPLKRAAELTVSQCMRLAEKHVATDSFEETLRLAAELSPEILVLSLELTGAAPETLIKKVRAAVPESLLIATFRELSVPRMEKLGRLGVDEFLAQPVDATDIFRAASQRYHVSFRRHERYDASIEVSRADGLLIGKTVNLSEGGMCVDVLHQLQPDTSILVGLAMPDGKPPVRVRFCVLMAEGTLPDRVRIRGRFDNLRGEEHRRLLSYLTDLAKTTPEE